MIIDLERIQARLLLAGEEEQNTCPPLPGLTAGLSQPAAVLIPLLNDSGIWKLLFIKRTHHEEDRHSGQIAFPGGRRDAGDKTLQATALREAAEEIGLSSDSVQILGQSCSVTTVTGYQITPYVGMVSWPLRLTLSADEVEKILLIPLQWLTDPSNHRTELWQTPLKPEAKIPVIFFDQFEGETLWGATAQILVDFLGLVELLREDTSPDQG